MINRPIFSKQYAKFVEDGVLNPYNKNKEDEVYVNFD